MTGLRLHYSTFAVGLLMATALVLIEAPGRVGHGSWAGRAIYTTYFEHGWPWVYHRREALDFRRGGTIPPSPASVRTGLPRFGIPWLSAENWRLWEANDERTPHPWRFSGWMLFCNATVALFVVGFSVVAWEFRRRRRPRLLSFRLADLMLIVTAVCLVLGWLTHLHRESEREKTAIVHEHPDTSAARWFVDNEICVAPRWLQSLTGPAVYPDMFWRAHAAYVELFQAGSEAQVVGPLSQLTYLREIEIERYDMSVQFSAIRSIRRLNRLIIHLPLAEHEVEEISQINRLSKLVLVAEDYDEVPPELIARVQELLPDCHVLDIWNDW